MIKNETLQELFLTSSIDKQLKLEFSGGDILGNSNIVGQSQTLTESLCSESSLVIGSCEASCYKITIINTEDKTDYTGQTLNVSMTLDGSDENLFQIGKYNVVSDTPTSNNIQRELVCYDDIYRIINYDSSKLAEWYNALFLNEDTEVTFKTFRDSFFDYVEVEQENVNLPIDGITIVRGINPIQLSGKDVLKAICELCGAFGHINRDGKFVYIVIGTVEQGNTYTLYPSESSYPSENIYPTSANNINSDAGTTYIYKNMYSSCTYEKFSTKKITCVQIRQEDGTVVSTYGNEGNTYSITSNFLTYGLGEDVLQTIAENFYLSVCDIEYQPLSSLSTIGNLCVEVGDGVIVYGDETVSSYVLSRTITGIQALTDSILSYGTESYTEETNSVQSQITQLKGSVKKTESTTEKVATELTDYTNNMTSSIEQNIDSLSSELKKVIEDTVTGAEEELSSTITNTAENLELEFTKTTDSLKDTTDELQESLNTLTKYFRFSEEGLEIGSSDSPLTLKLVNDKIAFVQDGETIGYWDGDDFHTGNVYIEVNKRAQFGNFAIVPRTDNSLMFLKVGNKNG